MATYNSYRSYSNGGSYGGTYYNNAIRKVLLNQAKVMPAQPSYFGSQSIPKPLNASVRGNTSVTKKLPQASELRLRDILSKLK